MVPRAMTPRDDAEAIFHAAVAAVQPEVLLSGHLQRDGDRLWFPAIELEWQLDRNVRLAAFGKAAPGMVRAAETILGEHIVVGIASVPVGTAPCDGVTAFHPGAADNLPDEAAMEAAERINDLAVEASADELLLVLISGGGSALLPLPAAGITLEQKLATTRALTSAGATISELNAVRRHLSELKGGRLAQLAAPATVVALAISDVIGDPLPDIASGPTVGDSSTYGDCLAIVARLGVELPSAVAAHLERGAAGELEETPAVEPPKTRTAVIGSNRIALEAAAATAAARGYAAGIVTDALEGEARGAGKHIARHITGERGCRCLLWGGETTVAVTGDGRGGRSQELALAAAIELAGSAGTGLLAAGTDGQDGPTDAAGAWVDGGTPVAGARAALDANDSHGFLAPTGALFRPGLTGTNVMDIVIGLVDR
jgi:glycerate-2-kinase